MLHISLAHIINKMLFKILKVSVPELICFLTQVPEFHKNMKVEVVYTP